MLQIDFELILKEQGVMGFGEGGGAAGWLTGPMSALNCVTD